MTRMHHFAVSTTECKLHGEVTLRCAFENAQISRDFVRDGRHLVHVDIIGVIICPGGKLW